MHDRWVKAANQGQVTGAVILDLSAAFDLVNHKILLGPSSQISISFHSRMQMSVSEIPVENRHDWVHYVARS